MKNILSIVLLLLAFQISCVNVKPYQKVYLNDEDMELTISDCLQFEVAFESYREGAAGAYGGKVGGGCGCN